MLIATGATPRLLPDAMPDGERILTWRQIYDLPTLPEHLIVIGSGVTGAEFASAYLAMGVEVTLVSSRDRVMPHEDADASTVIETRVPRAWHAHSQQLPGRQRSGPPATGVDGHARRRSRGHRLARADGGRLDPEHRPTSASTSTASRSAPGGYITTDRVSRTNVPGVYAAGDCTGVLPLASVAAMQGRIAMWHALGEAVSPLKLKSVAANVFTDPELATVGVSQADVDTGRVPARQVMLSLDGNARAKMEGFEDGFVKLFCRPASGLIVGGVVVAPRASELILPIAMAVENHLTVDQLAHTITIYPSLSGSIAEAARQLMLHELG